MSRILYGLTNPNMDAVLEEEIRERHPHWKEKQVTKEMSKVKQKATLFNEQNSKKNSTREPKPNNGNNPQPKKGKSYE